MNNMLNNSVNVGSACVERRKKHALFRYVKDVNVFCFFFSKNVLDSISTVKSISKIIKGM